MRNNNPLVRNELNGDEKQGNFLMFLCTGTLVYFKFLIAVFTVPRDVSFFHFLYISI